MPDGYVEEEFFFAGRARGYELDGEQMTEIVYDDASFSTPRRAKNAETFLFTRQTFSEYPDLRVSGLDFADSRKITDANPQQAEFKWGRRVLFDFENNDGVRLQGILALPDDYVAGEKRPMIVTFYEKNSQNLHRYSSPSYMGGMGSSPIQAVSEGYLTMLPDIHFRTGASHSDMLECVEAAVRKVIADKNYDGVIALGAVIRGATPHFDFIAAEVTKGLAQASLDANKPVAYGVITTDTIEQAVERAGTKEQQQINMSETTTTTEPSFAELFSQGPKAAKEGEVAQGKVMTYAREIVPSFNAYLYFRIGYWIAKKIARMLYRVRVGLVQDEQYAGIDTGSTVVFVMNHRSNMDYVLVAFLAAERNGNYEIDRDEKAGKLAAFTSARQDLKRKHPEPYFWAPFVCIGDPR